ncbi:MAG: T9SS type A sorting domain-containing protein [Ferruginibacter sp.]
MKKYLAICILVLLSSGIFAQTNFQATIAPVTGMPAVDISVKTPMAKTGIVSGLTLTIAIPVSASPSKPPLGVTYINTDIHSSLPGGKAYYDAIDQSIGGVPHYIYNILAESNLATSVAVQFDAGVPKKIVTISFGGNPTLSSQIKLVNLPDGGTDPNPNSYFGLSIGGADVVNIPDMFYAEGVISTAVNDGNGYSGTNFAQTTGAVPLPVKFLTFVASRRDNNALLNWQIENESSLTDHYDIERSLNGTSFNKMATVQSKNNGNRSNSYDLTDLNLSSIRTSGIFYYRVKQVDKDGHFIYSVTRSVRLNSNGIAIGIYPNPIREFANVTIDLEKDADATVMITDAAGKQVQNIQMQLFKGPNIKKINMVNLAGGNYMLKVQTLTEIKTIPVVKIN